MQTLDTGHAPDSSVGEATAAVGCDPADLAQAYERLRRIARRLMGNERVGHTLCATEVVHEALARLLEDGSLSAPPSAEPGEFVAFTARAARAMTHVLVDHARRRGAAKRGGGRVRNNLDDVEAALDAPGFDWLALDEALEHLRRDDPRRHSVVVLRFFGGLDNRQIAAQLSVDERTIGRDWLAARLWLRKRLDTGAE